MAVPCTPRLLFGLRCVRAVPCQRRALARFRFRPFSTTNSNQSDKEPIGHFLAREVKILLALGIGGSAAAWAWRQRDDAPPTRVRRLIGEAGDARRNGQLDEAASKSASALSVVQDVRGGSSNLDTSRAASLARRRVGADRLEAGLDNTELSLALLSADDALNAGQLADAERYFTRALLLCRRQRDRARARANSRTAAGGLTELELMKLLRTLDALAQLAQDRGELDRASRLYLEGVAVATGYNPSEQQPLKPRKVSGQHSPGKQRRDSHNVASKITSVSSIRQRGPYPPRQPQLAGQLAGVLHNAATLLMERGQLREAQAALEYALELVEHGAAVTDEQRALCQMRQVQVESALKADGE